MNHMKEVAQLLGVEIGEEFLIEDYSKKTKFKFSKDYLLREITNVGWNKANVFLPNLLNGKFKIVKLPKPILDDVEKRYLKGVIRPFRSDVENIYKCLRFDGKEYLAIRFKSAMCDMFFPEYPKGEMYKGMMLNKRYTIEELDL